MEISTSGGMSVIGAAARSPQVEGAQESLQRWQQKLDRVELDLSLPRQERFEREPELYKAAFESEEYMIRQHSVAILGMGTIAASLGTAVLATVVPALLPLRSILMLGAMGASVLLGSTVIKAVNSKFVLPRRVDQHMKNRLGLDREMLRGQVQLATEMRDAAVRESTEAAYKQAVEQQGTRPQDAGEVKVTQEYVMVHGVRVPRRDSGTEHAPDVG